MAAANPWRGERVLRLPGIEPVTLSASLDDIARLMSATGTETLDALQDKLFGRNPETLESALAVLLDAAQAKALMERVNGAAGLTTVCVAISGAVSGLTPEEEEEAKKAEADRERQMQALALRLLTGAVGQSSASHSESG